MDSKVAVITGANAGIGLSLADRLLTEYDSIRVCLACRNKGRADNARARLLHKHPGADVTIVTVDTSSVESVIKASAEIRKKYKRLDYLYLNAGMMKVTSLNWTKVLYIFSSQGSKILRTGQGVLNHTDSVTPEGLQEVFAANLFGHFVMVRELEDYYGGTETTQIVWTSSESANPDDFMFTNIQHRNGKEPYTSSKYATDLLSVALNERLHQKGIYSVTTSPGLVMSGMTYNILPAWVWMLILPFLLFMRLFVSSLTCSPHNAAESLIWVSKQRSESLNPRTKYLSNCSVFGKPYVSEEKLKIEDKDASNLYQQLDDLYQGFKSKYCKEAKNGEQNGFH